MASLIIIAGPNGAGKSTISKKLLEPYGITAFDFDIAFNEKWRAFNYDPLIVEGIRMNVIDQFNDHMNHAFTNRLNVSFETNFHDNAILNHIEVAKRNSYSIELVFMGLSNVELATLRVQQRVKEGGHNVDLKTIKYRYEAGLNLLDELFEMFDEVNLFESPDNFKPVIKCIYIEQNNSIVFKEPTFADRLPRLMRFVNQ